jgi:serine/threonine-protein kinase
MAGDDTQPAAVEGDAVLAKLSAGDVIADRYHVIRRVGRGGMGEVYEVEDRVLRVNVALKIMRAEYVDDDALRERFRREVHASSTPASTPGGRS